MTTGFGIYPDPAKAILLTGPVASLGSPGQERYTSSLPPITRTGGCAQALPCGRDYELRVQTSEALITIAACALMLKRIAPS
jgi:hypothetical protein